MTKRITISKAEIRRRIEAVESEGRTVAAVVFGDNGELRLEIGKPRGSHDPVGDWLENFAGETGDQSAP